MGEEGVGKMGEGEERAVRSGRGEDDENGGGGDGYGGQQGGSKGHTCEVLGDGLATQQQGQWTSVRFRRGGEQSELNEKKPVRSSSTAPALAERISAAELH